MILFPGRLREYFRKPSFMQFSIWKEKYDSNLSMHSIKRMENKEMTEF